MNDEAIYAAALAALEGGADPVQVDARIAELREQGLTEHPNIFSLRMAQESAAEFVEAEELMRMSGGPDAGPFRQALATIQNVLGSAVQGSTLGFADEIVEQANPNVGRRMRRAQGRRERHVPVGDLAAQLSGILAVPGAQVGRVAARPVTSIGSGAARGAARGALVGGAGGAAAGAGFAQPGERTERALEAVVPGAVVGGLLGGVTGGVGGLFGSAAGRGERIANEMLELTGLPSGSRLRALDELAEEAQEVRRTLYRPIEQAHEIIDDPAVNDFLRDLSFDRTLRRSVPERIRGGTSRLPRGGGNRGGVMGQAPGARPSFVELQQLRDNLRGRAYDRAGDIADREALNRVDELTELMHDVVGEDLRMADRAWAQIRANERMVQRGWQLYDQPFEIIQETIRDLPEAQRAYFNEGRLARITADLTERRRGVKALLNKYMDAGSDTRRSLATMFPGGEDGAAFAQFENMVRGEATTAAIADFFNSSIKSGAIGFVGGSIAGGLRARDY